jgi:HSP20 family protein
MARDDDRQQQMPARQWGSSGLSRGPYSGRSPESDWWNASPFQLMRRMHEDMDRIFGSFFGPSGGVFGQAGGGGAGWSGTQGLTAWAPSVDVYEAGNEYVVKVDVPGVQPEDLEVYCTDDELVIRGEMRREDERDERGGRWSERRSGRFERHIPLPAGTRTEEIRANCRHGVLELRVPKPAEAQPRQRRIPITSQAGAGTREEGSLAGAKGGEAGTSAQTPQTTPGSTMSQAGMGQAESADSASEQAGATRSRNKRRP